MQMCVQKDALITNEIAVIVTPAWMLQNSCFSYNSCDPVIKMTCPATSFLGL